MEVAAVAVQVDDRVPDELPGAVVGDVAAPLDVEDLDAAPLERLARGQEVLRPARAAEGDDRRVLAEEERVGHLASLAPAGEVALERQRLGVGDAAEVANDEPHRRQHGETCLHGPVTGPAGARRRLVRGRWSTA